MGLLQLKTRAVIAYAGLLFLAIGCSSVPVQKPVSGTEKINELLRQDWAMEKLTQVPRADDTTFLRRVRLDLTGRAPTLDEIRDFCADRAPDKRAKLVRRLLDTEEYADLMAMRYADIFRVKSEFPINLWPNAVQLYHRYLRDAARNDAPFRDLAREMLTASGSNFRVPAANFFRAAADRTPEGLAGVTIMTWLGLRLEKMPPETGKDAASFFCRIGKKSTAEWKEEIVFTKPGTEILTAVAPDGTKFVINTAEQDPRQVFADWLTEDRDLQFSKAWVNRAWYWLFGIPLSGTQPDDMPIPAGWRGAKPVSLPALNEALLNALARDFHESGGKMRALLETICLSDAYSADWKTRAEEQERATAHFAVYPVHRIEAEIVVDILADLTGHHERYRSVIPEPFTVLPPGTRAIQVADGSISSGTLGIFGRPPRDSGAASERNNAVTGSQRLYLMNSSVLYQDLEKLVNRNLSRKYKKFPALVNACYMMTLSRPAAAEELELVGKYAEAFPKKNRNRAAALDLLWCLINSKEFLYHH